MGDEKTLIIGSCEIVKANEELTPDKMREMGHKPMQLRYGSPASDEICSLPDDDPIKACFENPYFEPEVIPSKQSFRYPKMLPGLLIEDNQAVADMIFKLMKDIHENATDVYWASHSNTVFDSLSDIFIKAGGDSKILVKEFPEYYG